MPSSAIPGRAAAVFATAALILQGTATAMYGAAGGPASGLSDNPAHLLASGATGSGLLRWGSLIDMFGYLCLAPVVLYLRERYPAAQWKDVFAVAGLALVVIGSIGAAAMATAAPALINEYGAASDASRQAMLPAFATLYRAVVIGMWQTLESIPAAVWLLGNAHASRRIGPRAVTALLAVLGAINLLLAAYRLTSIS